MSEYRYYVGWIREGGPRGSLAAGGNDVIRSRPITSMSDVLSIQEWLRKQYGPTLIVTAFSRFEA